MPQRRIVARKTAGGLNVEAAPPPENPPPEGPHRRSQRRRHPAEPPANPAPTPQPFNFEDFGLGLEVPVSSGTTSDSDAQLSDPDDTSPSPYALPDADDLEPTPEWVRNLIGLRRAKHSPAARPSAAGKEWLREQHRALDAGNIPLTMKCTLAASAISEKFFKCRSQFMRPEYRARYWSWSDNFIALVDYYIRHGTINIPPQSAKRYPKLVAFIQSCQQQRKAGTLPLHRDQLLAALGLQWKEKKDKPEVYDDVEVDDIEMDDSESHDSPADETWELPPAEGKLHRGRKINTRKRLRSRRVAAKGASQAARQPEIQPQLQFEQVVVRPPAESDFNSMFDWAKMLVECRKYFRKSSTYDIPDSRPSLLIWKNTELARAATGTLSMIRCCLLKAAKLADAVETIEIDMECESWCRRYLEFLDYRIEQIRNNGVYKRASSTVFDFMYDCRESVIHCNFPKEYSILLRAADHRWLDSKLMEVSIMRFLHMPGATLKKKKPFTESEGHVVEVVLASGGRNRDDDQPPVRKKRKKKSQNFCQQMVSSMIKGIVAENIEGREKTEAERRAEEWVTKAGPKALNNYAHNWFDAAAKQTHR